MKRRDFLKTALTAAALAPLVDAAGDCIQTPPADAGRPGVRAAAPVGSGLDDLRAVRAALRGRPAGLVTNPSAINRAGRAAADVLEGVARITAYFAPEHGIRGDLQNGVRFDDQVDPRTGRMVYSIYGQNAHLTADRVKNLEVVIYDIQDVGSRAFSYLRTLAYLIEDCIALDRELLVLDRINPLGGAAVEGLLSEEALDKRWGYGVTLRFGLTVGEYARMVNKRCFGNRCRLTVIPCSNWKRKMMFEDTGLFWVNPAPNLPSPASALIYAGCAAFGQTSVSEARGTTRPYEMYGAPGVDAGRVAAELNRLELPGVIFRECAFTSSGNTFKKYVNEVCTGVQLFLTDRRRFNAFETGMWMLEIFRERYDRFAIPFANGRCTAESFDQVLGSSDWRTGRLSTAEFIARGRRESAEFQKSVAEFLLYA